MQLTQSILLEFQNGNVSPFYSQAYPSLLAYAMRLLGDKMAYMGEDCVSDAIFKAYCERERFTTPVELKAFVYACVHNEIVSLFRKNERHNRFLLQHNGETMDIIDHVVMQETLDRLRSVIEQLPPRLQQVYAMSYELGMKRGEIAEELQVSEATVKRDRQKIIEVLRDAFKDDIVALFIISVSFHAL